MKNRNLKHHDNWQTPADLYGKLNRVYKFNFDPCPLNCDLKKFNGLKIPWKSRNFINPPYSLKLKEAFVLKAIEESKKNKLCVMLLPVSTSTKLFHDFIYPNASNIIFIKGRVKFIGYNTRGVLCSDKSPMHDSMIVVFGKSKNNFQN